MNVTGDSAVTVPGRTDGLEATAPASLAVLAADSAGRQIVSVHVKQAYRILPSGTLIRAEKAEPLLFSREASGPDDLGVPESDVIPFKESTDVIVMAEAHAPPRAHTMDVRLTVGPQQQVYRVFGERRCIYHGPGSIAFGNPAPLEKVQLRYALAYGGVDPSWVLPDQVPLEDAFFLPPNAYPRNTIGLGYVISETKERLDGLPLPQIENPRDLLKPDRLLVGRPDEWWKQPFPWSCDWFDAQWYPRYGYFGVLPRGTPEDDRAMFEVRAGWVKPGQRRRLADTPPAQRLDGRFADGASPAWVLPFLTGSEPVRLDGVMPGGRSLTLQLPGAAPRVAVRFGGRLHEVCPRLHRVLISTVEMGVYLVWHAAFYPDRPLPLRHATRARPEPPDLDGVDVFVNGSRILSYDEWLAETVPTGA